MNFKNQLNLFDYLWETRAHVSEVSGLPLLPKGHSMWHFQFAHILSKGAYPRYKLLPENIMLMRPEEHEHQEKFEAFRIRKQELKERYYRESKVNSFVKND